MEKVKVTQYRFDEIKAEVKKRAFSSGLIVNEEEFGAIVGKHVKEGEEMWNFIFPGMNNVYFVIS